MGLFERAPELATIEREVRGIGDGGRVLVVTGDAGSGKTSLLAAAFDRSEDGPLAASAPRLVRGLCDPLATPRPLGPISEVLDRLEARPASLAGAAARPLGDTERHLVDLVAAEPTILVIEDAQWIDAASVEVLRHLVRRLDALPVLLVLSYRDTTVGVGHPLLPLLGETARAERETRLQLRPLTIDAVTAIVGEAADPARVLEVTGGNPFFVGEIARHPGDEMPATVRDAVLASTAQVDGAGRDILELIAVAPDGLDDRLLPPLGIDVPTLRSLEATGLLVRTRRGVGFRHELARLALTESIQPGVEALLHRRLLDAFERLGSGDAAVLTHHAAAADDGPRTLRHATVAAEEAIAAASHSEAVSFLELALEQLDDDPDERARLLEALSTEQYMVSRLPDSIESISAALRLREQLGDAAGIAAAHDRRAIVEYYSARRAAAETHASLAAAAGAGGDAEASARATMAYLAYRRHDLGAARGIVDGTEASAGSTARLRLSITDAAADLVEGRLASRGLLLMHAATAIERSLDEIGTTAYSNLSALDIEHRRFREAEAVLAQSIPLTVEREIPICSQWQTGMRARLHLLRGRWTASAEDAAAILDEHGAPLATVWPHLVTALLALRRGDGTVDVDAHLDAAWRDSLELGESLMVLAVLAAYAERSWTTGEAEPLLDEVDAHLARAASLPGTEWAVGELLVWLARLGARRHGAAESAAVSGPHRLELAGAHAEASAAWDALGAPFDAALSAVHGSAPEAARDALARLDAMGVDATAARARERLAELGVTGLPPRPRRSTLANPSGLTNRQLDVARLVAQGYTNAELADRLYISAKTADHHVSAILAKLGLASRRDIIRSADELGLG
ncbi:ATP-binding protein [Agromyces sp. NPDC058110]|uniref:ATP-binding protein n=1 Tax=Agromyces sp. NPDC058110 TaxID=3346345 RepID=UPI0036DE91AB